ncbi:MAG: PqqD family protein [Hungatella sp.]|nr:PqqD family protein [Hungatella sp.]
MNKYILCEDVMKYLDEDTKVEYIVNVQKGTIFQLNDTAKLILQNIEDEPTFESIFSKLSTTFPDAEEQTIKSDLQEFIDHLVKQNFISVK